MQCDVCEKLQKDELKSYCSFIRTNRTLASNYISTCLTYYTCNIADLLRLKRMFLTRRFAKQNDQKYIELHFYQVYRSCPVAVKLQNDADKCFAE